MLQALRTPASAWRPLAAVVLGVLALHAALILGWSARVAPALGLAAPGLPRPVLQVLPRQDARRLPSPASDAKPGLPDALAEPDAKIPANAVVAAQRQDRMPGLHAPRSPIVAVDARRLPKPAPPPDQTAVAGPQAGADSAAAADEAADRADAGSTDALPSGEPPPLYDARPPPAATLRYALHYYGRSGEAVLSWRPAGASYDLQLQGLPQTLAAGPVAPQPQPPGPANRRPSWRPLIEQSSQGQLDANGLAPDRFTDRRRGRGQRAANFRRELGRIEFSGPSTVLPAWPGAQDRLSWWVQLPAIVAAAASVPAEVRLFVVGVHGQGDLWRFDYLGLADGPAHGPAGAGQAGVQHWRHEPAQAEGQRVELWLDPAQNHWPVQLRLTSLRTGARLELQLLAIDLAPP